MLAYLQVALGAAAIAYGGLLFYAWQFSDRLIFQAPPATYPDGPDIIKIAAPDGVRLAARYLPWPHARYTLIYAHGNAEDLGSADPLLHELRERLGVSVLGWDYRGYGHSSGESNEQATLRDADTVIAYVISTLGVPPERIVLYGRSLGGGAAVDLAARGRYAGLILHGAFTSAFRVMTSVRLLPFDKFDNLVKLPQVKCPVLVIHGTADGVIPFSHGPQLYAAAHGPKHKLWVEGAGHNDLIETAGEEYWKALKEFVQNLDRGSP